jgi:hypothetical protein
MNCTSAHWTVTASEEVLQNTSTPVDTRGYRDIFLQEYPQPEVLTIKIGQGLRDVKGATNMGWTTLGQSSQTHYTHDLCLALSGLS